MDGDRYEQGLRVRREVLGDAYVDAALAGADDFTRDLQELVTEFCWGATWAREGLDRRQRSLNNLCLLAALNRPEEFKTHVRGALRNGCTLDELRETFLQIAVYAGVPAGIDAFKLARGVLDEVAAQP